MDADEVMGVVEEVRGAADAGAAAWIELSDENDRLRAENDWLWSVMNK